MVSNKRFVFTKSSCHTRFWLRREDEDDKDDKGDGKNSAHSSSSNPKRARKNLKTKHSPIF